MWCAGTRRVSCQFIFLVNKLIDLRPTTNLDQENINALAEALAE